MIRSPQDKEACANSDVESPPANKKECDSESPSPIKYDDEDGNGQNGISSLKSSFVDEDTVLVADNTHEIVMEKLEQYKADLAVMDRKKYK